MTIELPVHGRLAGIDFGTVRIGIAISDADRSVATPLENYQRGNLDTDARRFLRLVEEEDVVGFVVGLPVHTNGNESRKSGEARRFGDWLTDVTQLPVVFYDERFTSVQAEQALEQAGLTRQKRKKRLDMVAAQILLASYLESAGRTGTDSPGSLDD